MNLSLPSLEQLWSLLGLTMVLFFALGMLLLLAASIVRLALKRATPPIRYATSLATFALLALMPFVIASRFTVEREQVRRMRYVSDGTGIFVFKPMPIQVEKIDLRSAVETVRIAESITKNDGPSISLEAAFYMAVDYLPWLWLVGTPLTLLLLLSGLIGADRLRRTCQTLSNGSIRVTCDKVRATLGISRNVGIALCDSIATPLLVGVVKPLILLPSAALTGWSPEHLEMVLLHELAHVRRWDNAVNLAQRIVESVLFFHPAVWIVSNWVRRDREDCCDAVVVGHTAKPQAYAELLLALASHQPLPGLAASAMARHPLASRIRRILKLEDEPMLVSRKGLTLCAAAVMAVVLCVIFLASSVAEEPQASRDGKPPEVTTNDAKNTNQDSTREGTEERWPDQTAIFPSPYEGEIAARAWKLLGIKTMPATQADQEAAKKHSIHVGVKLLGAKNQNLATLPALLLEVNDKAVTSYKDLNSALDSILKEQHLIVIKMADLKFKVFTDFVVDGISQGVVKSTTEDTESTEERLGIAAESREIVVDIPAQVRTAEQLADILESVRLQGYKGNIDKVTKSDGTRVSKLAVMVPDNSNLHIDWTVHWQESNDHLILPEITAVDDSGTPVKASPVDPSETTSSLFPTLEEQKAADFAYKLLGVELEKLNPQDLERVKTKGYTGGLRVTSEDNPVHGLRTDDLLVGLHVWPTKSLEQVQEILTRFDIHEMTPLKFYVLRRQPKPEYAAGGSIPEGVNPIEDVVIKGRIAVNLTAWAEKERFKQKTLRQSEEKPATSSGKEERALTLKEAEIHHELAVKNYEQSLQANKNVPGSILQFELRKLKAAADLAQVEVERQRFQLDSLKRQIQKELFEKENERKKILGNKRTPEKAMLDAEIEQLQEIVNTIEHRLSKTTGPEQTTNTNSSPALYDGKTFEEWRKFWKTELKTEKRVECIKALAAFGRAGKGTEAAEAVLEVAGEYDFSVQSEGPMLDLKRAIQGVFRGTDAIDAQYWLPVFAERLEREPDKWSPLALWVLDDVRGGGTQVLQILKTVAKNPRFSSQVRRLALVSLIKRVDSADDQEAMSMLHDALSGNDTRIASRVFAELYYSRLDVFPEQINLLFHKDDSLRSLAHNKLDRFIDNSFTEKAITELLRVTEDPDRSEDHPYAFVALAEIISLSVDPVIRNFKAPIVEKLTSTLIEGETALLPYTLMAQSRIRNVDFEVIIEGLKKRVSEERLKELENAMKLAEELTQGASGMGSGGGGMF